MMKAQHFFLIALLLSLAIAFFLSPFASGDPDGLEKVAQDQDFIAQAEDAANIPAPLRYYEAPLFQNPLLRVGIAGLLGAAAVYCLGLGAGRLISRSLGDK